MGQWILVTDKLWYFVLSQIAPIITQRESKEKTFY